MNETKFKVLTYLGQFVDENMLQKGIYTTSLPNLKSNNVTIEGMIQQGEMMKDMAGNLFISQSYFDNLKQCKLLDFTLVAQAE